MSQLYGNYLKCGVVGDGTVGKTCMLMSYVNDSFPEDYIPTEADYDQEKVNLCLWDTAGQEDFDRLRPNSYPDTNVFIVAFSVVDPTSFENAKEKWVNELKEHFYNQDGGLPPIILCGTKTDLRMDKDVLKELRMQDEKPITEGEGKELAKSLKAEYVECSAKTLDGLENVFYVAIKVAKEKIRQIEEQRERNLRKKCCNIL